jgi:hypothetical protein
VKDWESEGARLQNDFPSCSSARGMRIPSVKAGNHETSVPFRFHWSIFDYIWISPFDPFAIC